MKDELQTFKTPVFPVKGTPDTLPAPLQEITSRKKDQSVVNYTDSSKNGKYCKNCTHFDPPVSCYEVNGMIQPNGYCNQYEEVKGIGLPCASNTTKNLPQSGVKKYQ